MDITTQNTTNTVDAASTIGRAAESRNDAARAQAASDFDSFLQLLTAQVQNQDPLDPIDSTQFVEQLASFSALEQQIETNSLLERMVSSSNVAGLESATQWIGREVDAPVNNIQFTGDPLTFSIAPGVGQPMEFVLRNSDGGIVAQQMVNPGDREITFDGALENGGQIAHGAYEAAINYADDQGIVVDTQPPIATARVIEAQFSDGALALILQNGSLVDPATIRAVRVGEPAPAQSATDLISDDNVSGDEAVAETPLTEEGENNPAAT